MRWIVSSGKDASIEMCLGGSIDQFRAAITDVGSGKTLASLKASTLLKENDLIHK
ncbi:MAG: hypothetical protein IAE97_14245 [Chthoniobacterales bacterium]|nr:hypothetical protein [Chthoniobacterales bacterium]